MWRLVSFYDWLCHVALIKRWSNTRTGALPYPDPTIAWVIAERTTGERSQNTKHTLIYSFTTFTTLIPSGSSIRTKYVPPGKRCVGIVETPLALDS